MPLKTLVILTPTRDEARSTPLVMSEIASARDVLALTGWSLSLLVIDDQSSDGTVDVVRREAAIRGIEVTIHEGPGSGLSRALRTGLHDALRLEPTLIATFDFDGQHDASQLPILVERWESSQDVDVVFGSRFALGGSVTGVRGFRKLISRSAQLAIRRASVSKGVPSDSTTSLRVFTPRVAQAFLDEVPGAGLDGYRLFSWFAVFTSCKFRYSEVAIDFRPRLNGVSKLHASDLVSFAIGLKSLREWSRDWMRQAHKNELFPEYPNEYLDDLGELDLYNEWIIGTFARSMHGSVADVGAGTGTVTGALSRIPAVNHVTAFEPDPLRFDQLVSATSELANVSTVCGTLADSPDRFDSLLYCNSLEHIDDLLPELIRASDACKPGATLAVFGPAMELVYGEVDRLSGHFRRFSISRLSHCLDEAGFDVIDAQYGDPVGALLYGISNRMLRNASLRPGLLPLYERVILPVSKAVAPLTKGLAGKNIIVIARKRPEAAPRVAAV